MPLDLYSLSITPPPPPPPPPSSNLTSPVNTIPSSSSSSLNKSNQNSPVIYPWMRKDHINNPG